MFEALITHLRTLDEGQTLSAATILDTTDQLQKFECDSDLAIGSKHESEAEQLSPTSVASTAAESTHAHPRKHIHVRKLAGRSTDQRGMPTPVLSGVRRAG